MNYEQMNNNQVQLVGVVNEKLRFSHEVFGENFYETTLAITRLSNQVDIIPITISDRLLIEQDLQVGDTIGVEGQLRSYNKLENEKSKLLLTTFVREFLDIGEYRSVNNIEITGYICKQPVYRTTPFKREICDVLIAVNRAYNKSDYIPCILWGRNARFVQNLSVGDKITITGRIQSRTYTKVFDDQTSEERVAYEVSANKVAVENHEGESYNSSISC